MLDYARQRAIEALSSPRKAVLVSNGPAGLQACELPCEVRDLVVYLLVPRTSDHLFNLEHEPSVTLLTERWELVGEAQVICAAPPGLELEILSDPGAQWCRLIRVDPARIQVRRQAGWGYLETIELRSR